MQTFCVRWDGVLTSSFNVGNGVRQARVLSPILFNVYMDDLSALLNNTRIGYHLNGESMNHFGFADDMSLLAPSPAACSSYCLFVKSMPWFII